MVSPTQLGLVLVTTSSEAESRKIAEHLLGAHLAACVTFTPVQSIYRWQGKIHQDAEYQLVIKTDLALFDQIAHQVRQLHSYELPEIIAVPFADSTSDYGQWIREQLEKDVGG